MSVATVHARPRTPDDGGGGPQQNRTGGGPTRGHRPPAHLSVQRLTTSEPTDPLEVEAETAAQRVVAGQAAGPLSAVGGGPARLAVGEEDETVAPLLAPRAPAVQRTAVGEEAEEVQRTAVGEEAEEVQRTAVGEDDETVQATGSRLGGGGPVGAGASAALRNPVGGAPVPPAVRSTLEPGLGADLGGVFVHDDATAHRTASDLHARALTYGNHIFLGRGESPRDVPLMAHEATHVVQQGAAFGPAAVGPAASGPTVHAARGDEVQRLPDFITDRLASYARHIPGYALMTVIIGYDPLAGVAVERSAVNLVGGLMGLVPFGTAVFDRLVELGVIQDALAFVEQQLATFDLSLERLERIISEAWDQMDFVRLDPFEYNLGILTDKVSALVADVTGFASGVVGALLDLIREAVVDVFEPMLAENPAWSLIKKVLKYDPLRDQPVEATTAEIIEDFLMLIGRETELAEMRKNNVLEDTAEWLDTQLAVFLGLVVQYHGLFAAAWEAIQPENLPDLMANLRALADQAISFLQQAWDFATTVAAKVLELVKKALLGWLSDFAHEVPGFHLLTVILGRNPFTEEEVPRTATNLIRGFITLLPGGNATYDQLAESGVIGQAAANIEGAMSELGISWAMVTELFLGIWDSLSIDDLVDPIGAFLRIRDRFGETIGRLFAFVMVVVREIFTLILALMSFPTDVVARIIANAMAAWADVSRDPVGFLLNLLATVKEGFTRFFAGIFEHLLGGLLDWLFRGVREAGIEPPAELSIQAGLDFIMQVLGITEDRLWAKLAERIGQDRVDQIRGAIAKLTGIWTFVKDVEERGIVAIWEYIQGQLSNLWDVILSTARNWIMEKIVIKVTMWLLSFLDPTFIMSVVNGFVFVFNAIASAIEYVREMLDIVDLVVGTIASIARGDVSPGAAMLEQGLVAAIPIAIGFLAYQVGLGRIGDKIAEIVGGVRELVDRALDWLMDQAERALQAVLGVLGFGGSTDEAGPADDSVSAEPLPGEWIEERPEGSHIVRITPDLRVYQFSTATLLSGEAALAELQQTLEQRVPREDPVFPMDSPLLRAKGPSGHVARVKENEERAALPPVKKLGGAQAYEPGDQRGHLIGDRFDGPGIPGNLVPMHPVLNLSSFKTHENKAAGEYQKLRNAGKPALIHMSVRPNYPETGMILRPISIEVTSQIITLDGDSTATTTISDNLINPSSGVPSVDLLTADPAEILAILSPGVDRNTHEMVGYVVRIRRARMSEIDFWVELKEVMGDRYFLATVLLLPRWERFTFGPTDQFRVDDRWIQFLLAEDS